MDAAARDQIRQRAEGRCEYCRLPDWADEWPFHVDHILARVHGGEDQLRNLCWSCTQCNLHKSSNFASVDPDSGTRVDLFALEVQGESMIEEQIADGDYVVIRRQEKAQPGEIVVAITDEGEATLKRWFPEKRRIRLEPANANMKPIYVKDARVLGVVVGVVRRVG